MTVKELQEALEKVEDKDMLVVTSASGEGGYDDVANLVIIDIALNVHNNGYEGKHENVEQWDVTEQHKKVKALLL